jgi:4-hydroxy-tetrahydrodipicolinate reductase
MTNVILCGCGGRMGQAIIRASENDEELRILAGIDINAQSVGAACKFPVYQSISEFPAHADVIIDFSHHTALPSLLEYAVSTGTPIVVATTGHTDEEKDMMLEAAKKVARFFSGNMSIGINLLIELCKTAAATLGESFDVEIIEKHHNKKLDAPSGTAIMIADAIKDERQSTEYVYDRHSVRKARESSEIGIHSVRGGTIVGEHEVIFAGDNELISLSHTATSREIFANGALRAAKYLAKKEAGLYNMSGLIGEQLKI